MTAELVDHSTGEVIDQGAVRDSIAVARSHGEKFFEQIVWQVENQVWTILGYSTWDEMREAEYGDMGVVAPRSDRPELVSRLRSRGLTQSQIAGTLGVNNRTVKRDLKGTNVPFTDITVTNARGQQRPASYNVTETTKTEYQVATETGEVVAPRVTGLDGKTYTKPAAPQHPRRRPLYDGFRDASLDLGKLITRVENLVADDRFPQNKNEVARYANDLIRARDALTRIIDQMS